MNSLLLKVIRDKIANPFVLFDFLCIPIQIFVHYPRLSCF